MISPRYSSYVFMPNATKIALLESIIIKWESNLNILINAWFLSSVNFNNLHTSCHGGEKKILLCLNCLIKESCSAGRAFVDKADKRLFTHFSDCGAVLKNTM